MRKTRAHPPTDRKTEDLRHYRRVIREAVRALDEAQAPRWRDEGELDLAGRIRELVANNALTVAILRAAITNSAVLLARSASSSAAVLALSEESSTSERRETAVEGSSVRAAGRSSGSFGPIRPGTPATERVDALGEQTRRGQGPAPSGEATTGIRDAARTTRGTADGQ